MMTKSCFQRFREHLSRRLIINKATDWNENIAATQLMKSLYINHQNNNKDVIQNKQIVNNAFEIYNKVTITKDIFLINTFLKLCLHFNHPHKASIIINDIKILQQNNQKINKNNVSTSFPLLLKCYINSNQIDINECMKLIKWIKSVNNIPLSIHSSFMFKLISKCKTKDELNYIYSLIASQFFMNLNNNIVLKTAFIKAFGRVSDIQTVWNIYNSIPLAKRDIVCIGTMMKICIDHKQYNEALELYDNFDCKDDIINLLAIKACSFIGKYSKGREIHKQIEHTLNDNIQIQTALIDLYGISGDVQDALKIFDTIPNHKKNIININAMMTAYRNNDCNENVIELYDKINSFNDEIRKDAVTYILAIKACTNTYDLDKGREIHSNIDINNDDNIQLKNTLIDFYGNCQDINNATKIFNSMDNVSIVSIGAMMDAFCKSNMNDKSVELFKKLVTTRKQPSLICYAILFKSCTNSQLYEYGKYIYNKLNNDNQNKWILKDTSIVINLIHMFGKCGMMDICKKIFDGVCNEKKLFVNKAKHHQISIYNAMIHAYGVNGDLMNAVKLFETLKRDDIGVNAETFGIILNACSHNNDMNEAKSIWQNQIIDTKLRYNCYVITPFIDCLSRNGYLKDAFELILEYDRMNKYYLNRSDNHIMWIALLSGCNKYDDTEMAQTVYNEYKTRLIDNYKFKQESISAFKGLMSNIYGFDSEFVNKLKEEINNL